MKFIVLILLFLGILISSKVSAPFTTLSQALADTWNETFGRVLFIALPLEVLRQIHYYVSEHWGHYNRFWSQQFFGGIEHQATVGSSHGRASASAATSGFSYSC